MHPTETSDPRFNIEPFFFSSSLNWIPSRYQEDVRQSQGDRECPPLPINGLYIIKIILPDITITLTFLRTMENPMTAPSTPTTGGDFFAQMISRAGTATIDPQAPLVLRSSE